MSLTGRIVRGTVLALAALALATGPAAAQDRGVTIAARGGGVSALEDLNETGSQEFNTGFNVGGGARVDLNKYLAVRGDFTFARAELQTDDIDTGTDFNKFFYGGAVQLQLPLQNGIMPYVFGGGGAVTLHEEDTSDQNETRGMGMFGAGLSYAFPRTNWSLFAEGTGFVYKLDDLEGTLAGVDETQLDTVYSGGVSYRIPF